MWERVERNCEHDIWQRRNAEGEWEYATSYPRDGVAVEPCGAATFTSLEDAREACKWLRGLVAN